MFPIFSSHNKLSHTAISYWLYCQHMKIVIAIVALTLLLSIIAIIRLEKYEVTYVRSDIDGKTYLVRDLPDKQQAADLLAQIMIRMTSLVDQTHTNAINLPSGGNDDSIMKFVIPLREKIQYVIINESTENNAYTSYSVNKGEQIVFCLRSKQDNKLHEINLIMYVAIHELSHVACPEYGHTDLFRKIFAFLTKEAIKYGIYSKIDFQKNPVDYCGLTISESIV